MLAAWRGLRALTVPGSVDQIYVDVRLEFGTTYGVLSRENVTILTQTGGVEPRKSVTPAMAPEITRTRLV